MPRQKIRNAQILAKKATNTTLQTYAKEKKKEKIKCTNSSQKKAKKHYPA